VRDAVIQVFGNAAPLQQAIFFWPQTAGFRSARADLSASGTNGAGVSCV
jgi:hypothetical protein